MSYSVRTSRLHLNNLTGSSKLCTYYEYRILLFNSAARHATGIHSHHVKSINRSPFIHVPRYQWTEFYEGFRGEQSTMQAVDYSVPLRQVQSWLDSYLLLLLLLLLLLVLLVVVTHTYISVYVLYPSDCHCRTRILHSFLDMLRACI